MKGYCLQGHFGLQKRGQGHPHYSQGPPEPLFGYAAFPREYFSAQVYFRLVVNLPGYIFA